MQIKISAMTSKAFAIDEVLSCFALMGIMFLLFFLHCFKEQHIKKYQLMFYIITGNAF